MPIPAPAPAAAGTAVAAPLPGLAALTLTGADAASFLHGQLSTDVTAMSTGAVALTSYNSAKGRVLATLWLFRRSADEFVALAAADLAAALRKRLSMFVLRAKVVVGEDVRSLVGVTGNGADAALAGAFGTLPAAGHGVALPEVEWVALPDGRHVLLADPGAAAALPARLVLPAAAAPAFDLAGIRAGVPVVTLPTQDRFVPQSLNLDLLGGVHFRKGCYPGQEIVARMQYLGRLKERLFALRADGAPPAPGTPLFDPAAPDQAVGTVVNAASADGGSEMLAVANFEAAAAGTLRLGAPEGPPLALRALPYAIPVPTAPQRVKL